MRLAGSLTGSLLLSLAACTAPSLPAPSPVPSPLILDESVASAGAAPPELIACMERARVAAMVAVRPGQAHPVADGCVRLVVENAFSANFIVTRVLLVLDGSRVFDRAEQVEGRGRLANTPLFRAFLDARAPGKHELQVLVNMKGDGAGATFYMKGYRFEVRSHHELMLVSTGGIEIRVVLYEKTPMSPKLEERPALRYEVITRRPLTEPLAPP